MNRYNNPHQSMPMNQQPNPGYVQPGGQMYSPQQGMRPTGAQQLYAQQSGQPQQGYPQQGYTQQMQQINGFPQQGYPRPQPMPQMAQAHNVQVMNTPQGPMFVDMRTNQILGPAQPQGQGYAQPQPQNNAMQMYQGGGYPQNARFGPGLMAGVQAPSEIPDNRYGQIQQLTQTERTSVMPEYKATPEPVAVPPTPVVTGSVMCGLKSLPGVQYKSEYRTIPFQEKDVRMKGESVIGESLYHVISGLINTAHTEERKELVWLQSGIIVRKFYDTSVKAFENDLFQGDVEAAHKVFKQRLPEIDNRSDVVYYQAYDKWITSAINDFLHFTVSGGLRIDSFAEDFAELLKHLSRTDGKFHSGLVDYMNLILSQSLLDVQSVREKDDEGNPVVSDETAVLPDRVSLVYIKLLSSEIGDDSKAEGLTVASRLMSSLEESIGDPVFYMATLDRRIYKVSYMHDTTVNIECLSD